MYRWPRWRRTGRPSITFIDPFFFLEVGLVQSHTHELVNSRLFRQCNLRNTNERNGIDFFLQKQHQVFVFSSFQLVVVACCQLLLFCCVRGSGGENFCYTVNRSRIPYWWDGRTCLQPMPKKKIHLSASKKKYRLTEGTWQCLSMHGYFYIIM